MQYLAAVINVTENVFYQLGTFEGILKQVYARSQFTLCSNTLLRIEDIPVHKIPLQSVVMAQSRGRGQGICQIYV